MDIEDGVAVKILFFAQSKDLAGARESLLIVPRKVTYHQLLNLVVKSFNLAAIKNHILLAKNEEVCDETVDIDICERDCIAVIPPLSGG